MQVIEKSSYKLPADIRNILLIQLGDIGDVVWTTPGIRAIKESMPNAKVSILVKETFGDLLKADPFIENVYEVRQYRGGIIKKISGHLSYFKALRARHFDLAIDLRQGDRGAFMAFASGAPLRVTIHYSENFPWLRRLLFTHAAVPADLPPERGAAEQSLRILRTLGFDTADKVPRLWIPEEIRTRVVDILSREKIDNRLSWVTINPFSRWSYKEWIDARWAEVIDWLWDDFGLSTLIVGAPDERPKADTLIRCCRTNVFNLAGKTTLAELAGLLNLSRLHIGVDSAAPHIAAATGVPTVMIYGPSSWFDWAPVGPDHRVVLPEMDCSPCHQKGCEGRGRSLCLEELDVDRVKTTIRETILNTVVKTAH